MLGYSPSISQSHRRQAEILVLDRIAQTIAGGVKIGKQAFDIVFRRPFTKRVVMDSEVFRRFGSLEVIG